MSQGLAWNEDLPYSDPANSEIQMDLAPDLVRYALSQPVVVPPGSVWNDRTASAAILAALLHMATGQPLDELARTTLILARPLSGAASGGRLDSCNRVWRTAIIHSARTRPRSADLRRTLLKFFAKCRAVDHPK